MHTYTVEMATKGSKHIHTVKAHDVWAAEHTAVTAFGGVITSTRMVA
jgi:hypothetical protein